MENKKLALKWLKYAKTDHDAASHLYHDMHPAPLEIICYHSQQCAEKALKAVLIFLTGDYKKIHDLNILLGDIEKVISLEDTLSSSCARLNGFSTQTRYPDEEDVDDGMTQLALRDALKVYEAMQQIIMTPNEQDGATQA